MSSFVTAGGDIGNGELLAQNAQQTANNANNGITDINDPNKLGPAEKATLKRKYDTDVLLYGMDTKKLTDNQLSTSEIDSAMSALTAYMTPFFANMSTTDTVDRDTLNTVYKNFDTADKNADSAFTNMVSSAASDAMVAGSQASVAGSEAVVAGNQASQAASNAAVQASVAVSNANVANSNATSGITIARSAANDMAVVSEAVTALKGGSTLTLAQLENGLQTKITAGDLSIGGRNYVLNSDFYLTGNNTSKNNLVASVNISTFSNRKIIVSVQIDIDNVTALTTDANYNRAGFEVKLKHIDGSYMYCGAWWYPKVGDSYHGRYYQTWDLSNQTFADTTAFNGGVYVQGIAADSISVGRPKLEIATVPTDYSQAPEDFSQLVETKTADLAETMVKNSDFATYKDQTAGAISQTVNKAIGDINNRNLALNTATPIVTVGQNKANQCVSIVLSQNIPANQPVTIAYDIVSTTAVGTFYTQHDVIGSIGDWTAMSPTTSLKTTSQHVASTTTETVEEPSTIQIRFDNITGTVTVTNVMVVMSSTEASWLPAPEDTQSDITQSINNIHLGFQNPDGSKFQMNLSADGTALMDFSKIMLNGATNIQDLTVTTAKLADMAVTNAKIGKLAVGNAQIADLAVTSAKVSEIDAGLIKSGTIDTNRLNADAIIANVINGKTITGITINTPTLNLGANGTLTTSFNLNQATSLYAPKKGTGTLKISTGVINSSSANMSRYSNTEGYWYGFDDNGNMVKNGTNQTGDDYAPGYEKHDIMKSNGNVLNRSYLDAMALALNEGGTQTFNTMLTAIGLETGNALLHQDLATEGTFEARLGTDNTYGFKIDTQVVSPMIRANSYTYAADVFISSYGTMGVTTSTKANKLDIVDVPNMLQKGYNLLTINPRQWFDKTSVEAYADVQAGNTDSVESVVDIKPVTGMVAEEVASAGLDDYVVKDENNKVQGLAYDRLWTLLLPVLRDMNDRLNEAQLEITKLKGVA
ncbi:hypothetical protein [Pediococcus ethanolidurans]|uniref:Peptidase S74 domain-containing protein n=1 Tax=Pediococcus ethanolidurans TaxID=319653 RepID=A0A0R2K8U1_9LACO|nr:hypothetical protein [Pediococcus ethanolidurans]KRN82903.1 hypothetical protein IV87_GL001857 [Pediococcus ethanolidurans]GEN94682.1 hypothetical protein PET01_07320 [Pediococcus ethanolidurans]SER17355.1 hypothetical protein SAMN04487973_102139 [Pediococcus ethanolidurans]